MTGNVSPFEQELRHASGTSEVGGCASFVVLESIVLCLSLRTTSSVYNVAAMRYRALGFSVCSAFAVIVAFLVFD